MRLVTLIAALLVSHAARADVPRVIADIAPVHSIVAQVMGDLGAPSLLLDPQADPHHMQLRPSQARRLAKSDLVVWVGEGLTPWMPRVLANLGSDTQLLELLEQANLALKIDTSVNHGDEHDEHEAENASKDDHHHAHDHGLIDPHIWLDPRNGIAMAHAIAGALGKIDPINADQYRANAAATESRLTQLETELAQDLQSMHDAALIPYHDAYSYFFIRFDLPIHGALSGVDGSAPSAARISNLRSELSEAEHFCLFTEPGANPQLLDAVSPDAPRGLLDPLGSTIEPGPAHYTATLRALAAAIKECQ